MERNNQIIREIEAQITEKMTKLEQNYIHKEQELERRLEDETRKAQIALDTRLKDLERDFDLKNKELDTQYKDKEAKIYQTIEEVTETKLDKGHSIKQILTEFMQKGNKNSSSFD